MLILNVIENISLILVIKKNTEDYLYTFFLIMRKKKMAAIMIDFSEKNNNSDYAHFFWAYFREL